MIIRAQQVFDKFYLDMDDSSEIIKYIFYNIKSELVTKVMDELKDHKLYIVKLNGPGFIEDLSAQQCAYRQDLECGEVVQCKDCRMVYPWCQKFRDELGGNGFCPYGKPAEVFYIDEAKADIAKWSSWSKTYEAMCEANTKGEDNE